MTKEKDMEKQKYIKLILYAVLMVTDIYILGSIDFFEHKIWGVLFVVVNTCLVHLLGYVGKDKE